MLFKRLASAAVATAVGLGTAGSAYAEDVSVSAEDLSALVQRLDAAERRIQELESEAVVAPEAGGLNDTRSVFQQASRTFVDPEDTEPMEDRINKLENNWIDLQSQIDEGFVSDGTSRSSMVISGRIHGDVWTFPDVDDDVNRLDRDGNPQDRLIWRRVRFGVKGKIQTNMHYKIEMEFADPNDTQYRDLYVGFDNLPWLQTVRIGNQKRPLGLDHINSSRYNVFLERPFVVEAFNQDARRLGIVSYGVTPDQAWNWRYGFYNPELTQGDEGYTGDHWQGQIAGRLANTAWWDECTDGRSSIHWAVAGSAVWPDGDDSAGPGRNEARFDTRPEARTRDDWLDTGRIANTQSHQQLGLESVLNFGPVQVVGEVEQTWLSRDNGSPDAFLWGGYAYVSYFLTGEHMPWDRKTGQLSRPKPFQNFFLVNTCDGCTDGGWGAWQLAARYSYADFNDEDITGGEAESLTLGLNWYWNPNSRLQLNYIKGQITDGNNAQSGPMPVNGDYDIFGARFMVDF